MNQAEFAKLHGVSRKTVTAWKARGWLVLDGEDIDVDASNERIRRYRKTVTRIKNEQKGNTLGNRVTSEGNTPGNNEGNEVSWTSNLSYGNVLTGIIVQETGSNSADNIGGIYYRQIQYCINGTWINAVSL